MNLSKENQDYDKQWDIVDTYYNNQEPEGFGDLVTQEEEAALREYYFVDHRTQGVYEHRERLVADNPELVKRAEDAMRKIAIAEGVDLEDFNE